MREYLQRALQWWSRVPPRLRVLWVASAVLLVGVPVALNLGRSSEFEASVEAFPAPRPGFAPIPSALEYMRGLLRDPITRTDLVRQSQLGIDADSAFERVRLEQTPRSVLVTARGDSPTHARDLANGAGSALANASGRDIQRQASNRLAAVRERLSAAASAAERSRLEAEAARLRADISAPPQAIVVGPRATAPEPRRAVDRVLAYFPGPLPPRPDPIWTLAAGLLLTALVAAGSYAYTTASRGSAHTRA